jgi:hypothetical protein
METDYQPCIIVEDQGFRSLIEELEPRNNMTNCTTFFCSTTPEFRTRKRRTLKLDKAYWSHPAMALTS